jgi:hypothetical protein
MKIHLQLRHRYFALPNTSISNVLVKNNQSIRAISWMLTHLLSANLSINKENHCRQSLINRGLKVSQKLLSFQWKEPKMYLLQVLKQSKRRSSKNRLEHLRCAKAQICISTRNIKTSMNRQEQYYKLVLN